ncbi:Hypothetical predicted protein, partial [Marmota monax]
TPPELPSQAHHGKALPTPPPQKKKPVRTHVQQGTHMHMLISGSPRPPSPAVEVTTAGADTPPNSLTLGRLLFHNLGQRWSWGTAPPASLLAPLPLVL